VIRKIARLRTCIGAIWAFAALALPVGLAAAAPAIDLSRSSVDFGYVARGTVSPVQPVFVTNTGDAPLAVSAVTLGGSNPGEFAVAGTCAPPLSLPPGQRCRVDVTMNPSGPRGSVALANVSIQSNAAPGSAAIALNGAVDPVLTSAIFVPTPEWVDFPPQPVGVATAPLTLSIANRTSLTFTIDVFALSGGDAGDFQMSADCAAGQRLAPGRSCTATIRFTPKGAGPRSTELVSSMSFSGVSGTVGYSVTGTGTGAGSPPAPAPAAVVEYYNASLDHYFITWIADEIAKLDAGTTIKGWQRTGQGFGTHTAAQAGTSPVCRYYIPPALGDSHFFGRGTAECEATGKNNPSFILESTDFMHMYLPVAGVCPAGTVQVYRVFSNRPDANHRYLVDRTLRDQMAAKGWVVEGDGPDAVVMCAPG
jgi:hypothetical protein